MKQHLQNTIDYERQNSARLNDILLRREGLLTHLGERKAHKPLPGNIPPSIARRKMEMAARLVQASKQLEVTDEKASDN